MGSSLGPVLANIILSEFEKLIVSDLIESGIIKFNSRYGDDTLVLIKPSNIPIALDKFNSFDKNLKFTVDTFSDNAIHFLDILILSDNTDVYYKTTHTNTHISLALNHFRAKLHVSNHYFIECLNYAAPVNCLKTKFRN
jgi:hypothetical protein